MSHYMTSDRGKTWRSFEMEIPPALVGKPLSFHSDPAKYGYILYQGTRCESSGGWGSICYDEVGCRPSERQRSMKYLQSTLHTTTIVSEHL